MPSNFYTVLLPPFKGLNLRDDPTRLLPGECVEATNVFINPDGSTERTQGYTNKLNSSLGVIYCHSLTENVKIDNTVDVYFVYDTSLYRLNPFSWEHKEIHKSCTADALMRYANYNNYVYFGDAYASNKKIAPQYIHFVEDTSYSWIDECTDEATAVTLANNLKQNYNLHRVDTDQHNAADSTNIVATANATATGTPYTGLFNLAVELRADTISHNTASGIHPLNDNWHHVSAIEPTDDTDLAEIMECLNQTRLALIQHIENGPVSLWNIVNDGTAMTGTAVTGTGLDVGTYGYCYTYWNDMVGQESPPMAVNTVTTVSDSQIVDLSEIIRSEDPQVTHKFIYRTVADGATYYYVDAIENPITIYEDSTPDASLNEIITTEDYTSLPICNIFTVYNDRVFMAGNPTYQNRMFFSEPGYPDRYNEAYNYLDYESRITALCRVESGLFVFEKNKTWFESGSGPNNFSRYLLSNTVGCTNKNGVAYLDKTPVWISDDGVYTYDGTTVKLLSEFINPSLLLKNLDNATLCYDALNKKLYVVFAP